MSQDTRVPPRRCQGARLPVHRNDGATITEVQALQDGTLETRLVALEQGSLELEGLTVEAAASENLLVRWDLDGTALRAVPLPPSAAIAIAPDGGAWVAGNFSGPLEIGPFHLEPATSEVDPAGGYFDAFVAHLDPDGAPDWAGSFGAGGFDAAQGIATDDDGNAYVVGHIERTVALGAQQWSSEGERDAFVLSLRPDGTVRWSRVFGGGWTDVAHTVAVRDDRVIVGGGFQQEVDFGMGVRTSVGSSDGFLVAFDLDGNVVWDETYGTEGPDDVQGVAGAEASPLAFVGTMYGPVDLGAGPLPHVQTTDVVVAVYDPSGEHQRSAALGGPTSLDGAGAVAIGDDGAVTLGGFFTQALDLPGCPLTAGGQDGFVARLRP